MRYLHEDEQQFARSRLVDQRECQSYYIVIDLFVDNPETSKT